MSRKPLFCDVEDDVMIQVDPETRLKIEAKGFCELLCLWRGKCKTSGVLDVT